MKTLNKVVADTKQLRPTSTTFNDDLIAGWVWSLEQKIVDEIIQPTIVNELGETVAAPPLGSLEDVESWDEALSVSGTYESMYALFAIAQVDYFLQEYEAYNNSVAAFNGVYEEYRRWYIRNHENTDYRWKGVM